MYIQVTPDWSKKITAAEFAEEFTEIPFNGPGFYLTANDTLLVLPEETSSPEQNPWKARYPHGMVFRVHVFNTPIQNTIFNWSAHTPTRYDSR